MHKRLGIGTKLTVAFAALATVTVLVVVLGFFAGMRVTRDIELAQADRLPGTLTSERAQASLLRMQLHVRGYLVLGDPVDVEQFHLHRRTFEENLATLSGLVTTWSPWEARQIEPLKQAYAQWIQLPQKLFDLHDNPLKNRPALRLARFEVQPRRVEVLSLLDAILGAQKSRDATPGNRELMADLAGFQTSFDAMVTNLMAFAASGELNFKLAYGPQLATNAALWQTMARKRASLPQAQRAQFDLIERRRAEIGEIALNIINILNGERAYEDLYLYRTEGEPLGQQMLRLLEELTAQQQAGLQTDLARARDRLISARVPALLAGLLATALAVALALVAQRLIVGPVRRLTQIAEQVAGADQAARSDDESTDEIGQLAQTLSTRLRKDELQQLMASISDFLWRAEVLADGTLAYRYFSPVIERIAGAAAEFFLADATRWAAIVHADDRATLVASRQRIASGSTDREDAEYRIVRPDGEVRWLRDSARATRRSDGCIVLNGVVSDVTERKRIEEELRARQEMLDLAQTVARAVAFETRVGVHVRQSWSPELETLYGLAPGSYDGTFRSWKKLIHPDDWPAVKDAIRRSNTSGEIVAEYRVTHPQGAVRTLQAKGRMFFDDAGRPSRMVGLVIDVSEQRHAEEGLRRLERQLRQAQRLEAMGTLAGGIAHDFNNILAAILGYGEMALRDSQRGSRLRRDLDSIMAAGERGRALVDRILAFSRSGVGEKTAVHIEEVVHEALELVAAKLPEGVVIESRLNAGRAAMQGDPTQVHQVLMNLATNALQAMPAGGTLRVSLESVTQDTAHVATTGTVAAGDYVVLTVADTGTGIAPDIVERIFDPFFTTKEVGVGTGLGLSLVHGIVGELGGAVDVESVVGEGSSFTVFFPRAGDAAEEADDELAELAHGERQQVLVVDDEEPLARLTTENLTDLGYVPIAFTSSSAARDAFLAHPERFDAVITDERMPGLTGSELIGEIRAVAPHIPVLLVSGFLGADVVGRARDAGADEMLKKPLSRRDLAAALARLLGPHAVTRNGDAPADEQEDDEPARSSARRSASPHDIPHG